MSANAATGRVVLVCDGCGVSRPAEQAGRLFRWYSGGKPAPGWRLVTVAPRSVFAPRLDFCRNCADKAFEVIKAAAATCAERLYDAALYAPKGEP